jgi:hypothetical protein
VQDAGDAEAASLRADAASLREALGKAEAALAAAREALREEQGRARAAQDSAAEKDAVISCAGEGGGGGGRAVVSLWRWADVLPGISLHAACRLDCLARTL